MSADYEEQAARVKTIISTLKTELAKTENGVDIENPFLTTFRKHENIGKLTRDCLIELVEHIKVYEGGDISVSFKYGDDYGRVLDYIEINAQAQDIKKAG